MRGVIRETIWEWGAVQGVAVRKIRYWAVKQDRKMMTEWRR